MASNLTVNDLDFKAVKQNLIDFLKAQNEFKDYDFTASSLNVLIDMLAYNTHYMGFYAHMLANESFIDSAKLKSSLNSKAKLLNYIPKSKKSAKAEIVVSFDVGTEEPDKKQILLARGTEFVSRNNASDNRTFVVTEDHYAYDRSTTVGTYDYKTETIDIYEGSFETQRFTVDKTLVDQRFIITDTDVDITTLRVKVFTSENDTIFNVFKLASDFDIINSESQVYFLTVNEENYYEIRFGNDVYGMNVDNGNYIEVSYVSTSGETGNFAKTFLPVSDYNFNGRDYSTTVETVLSSAGGMDAESMEDLRFNIPYHYRRQNRCVTMDDYKNLLLTEYRNINSINVWGGEDNTPPAYGKVFISIKPKYGEVLSQRVKNILLGTLKKYNTATIEPEIVDPDYLYINLDTTIRFNPLNTELKNGEIQTLSNNVIEDYDSNVLNKFGSYFSNVDLNSRIKAVDPSILTVYNDITIEKRFEPILYTPQTYYVNFLNQLEPNSLDSEEFLFNARRSKLKDDGNGTVQITYYDEYQKVWLTYVDSVFGTIDYANGIVKIENITISALYNNREKVYVFAEPSYPDFFTKQNNIVIIDDYKVTVLNDYQTESNKV